MPIHISSIKRPITLPLLTALLLVACGEDLPGVTDGSSTGTSTGDSSDDTTANPSTLPPTTVDPPTTTIEPTSTTGDDPTGPITATAVDTDDTTTTGDTDDTTTTGDTADTSGSDDSGSSGSTTGAPFCGDNNVDPGEVCDDGVNDGSYNGCTADCQALGPYCGDGEQNGPELCDDANLENDDGCTTACAPSSCGDNVVVAPEDCDSENLNGADCILLGFTDGILQCTDLCSFDTSACTGGCGDGVKADDEACDGADLNGEDCVSKGFSGGTLACNATCDDFDTAQCVADECGNDVLEGSEVCDTTQLGGATCASVDPNKYAGGTLACNNTCDGLDSSGCNSGGCCEIDDEDSSICTIDAIYNCACDIDIFCCFIWDSTCREIGIDECGSVCP